MYWDTVFLMYCLVLRKAVHCQVLRKAVHYQVLGNSVLSSVRDECTV